MKYSKFRDSSESPGLLFWQVSVLWQRKIKEALKPYGITHTQFVILAVSHELNEREPRTAQKELNEWDSGTTQNELNEREPRTAQNEWEPCVTQNEISDYSMVDVMTVSTTLRLLEKKLLVSRTRHPSDTRAKRIRNTEQGEEVLRTVNPIIEAVDEKFFFDSAKDRAAFLRLLSRLKDV